MTNIYKLSTRGFIFLTSIILFIIPLQAQDFEVAPVLVAFDGNPGEIQTQSLTLRNYGSQEQRFSLNLSDYQVNEDGSKQSIEPGSSDRTLADWITINPSFVDLLPNEEAKVELIMRVPRTGFSTRWGMIQVEVAREQLPSEADKQLATGVVIVPRIVVLVKQSPRSNQNFSGRVSGLKEVESKGNAYKSFEALLENTGDKILDAKAFLALANMESAEEQVFNSKSVSVYPGQKLKVELSLAEKPAPGQYALAFLMDYGKRSAIEGAQLLLEVK